MPQDDYTPTTSGTLKLKGVKASKVEKHKKKRKRDPSTSTTAPRNNDNGDRDGRNVDDESGDVGGKKEEEDDDNGRRLRKEKAIDKALAEEEMDKEDGEGEGDDVMRAPGAGKTEAERRHDERRRKRVCLFTSHEVSVARAADLFASQNRNGREYDSGEG